MTTQNTSTSEQTVSKTSKRKLSTTNANLSTKPKKESWWHWRPTSTSQVQSAEKFLLDTMSIPYEQQKVDIGGNHINTLICGDGPPLVLFHGFGAGLALWLHILPTLSTYRKVYAIDLPGFGRSGRRQYSGKTADSAEKYFLADIEKWREAIGLDVFTIMGHSFGAYMSALYALNYPEHVKHVILMDPWGVPKSPQDGEQKRDVPLKWRIAGAVATKFNPLAVIRVAGPWGPDLVTKFRPDLARKFRDVLPTDTETAVLHYIYHINSAENPAGEDAFHNLTHGFGWATSPLVDRLPQIDSTVPVSFLYGEESWMDQRAGLALANAMAARACYSVIPGAGHHIYADNPEFFLQKVEEAIQKWDNYKETVKPF